MKLSFGPMSISDDFLRIQNGDIQFLITKVPKEIGPSWSANIGIEYSKKWGKIPDPTEREMIRELCSFVLGRQLLLVGYTLYNENGNPVEEYACNPLSNHPRSLCSKVDNAPIRVNDYANWGKAEGLISQILPKYIELRNPLHLEEALWFYWISRDIAIGMNLPILWSAVEEIINGWFDHKSHGVYMKKDEFETLFHEEISQIENKLADNIHKDSILKQIKDAYRIGVTDRLRFFFEEIKLHIDEQEWNSINARHDFAHGRIDFDSVDLKSLINKSQTYETLFHKIILKLLGYSESYIDRSTIGFPDKKLE